MAGQAKRKVCGENVRPVGIDGWMNDVRKIPSGDTDAKTKQPFPWAVSLKQKPAEAATLWLP
jgi:hypothetical protein